MWKGKQQCYIYTKSCADNLMVSSEPGWRMKMPCLGTISSNIKRI